uniref:Fibrinogen C-terminal domain-containing protein n=1 Tax=Anopheles christyi TaxID=43041 RepID=A0A182KAJ6_9DIPT
MLASKLEYLQDKIIETMEQKLSGAIDQLNHTIDHKLNALQTRTHTVLSQQMVWANEEKLWKDIQLLASNNDIARFALSSGLDARSVSSRSCKGMQQERTGKLVIQPTGNVEPFLGLCEQTRFGGGWLVIQRRDKGLLNFRRNWTAYRNGFGSIAGEFWLGLERLHQLTSARPHELLVELKYTAGEPVYAHYREFQIGSEVEQYTLKKLGAYTGAEADNLLLSHRNKKFSTMDRDNDAKTGKDLCLMPLANA